MQVKALYFWLVLASGSAAFAATALARASSAEPGSPVTRFGCSADSAGGRPEIPVAPGVTLTPVAGDHRREGRYTVLLRFSAGGRILWHHHTTAKTVTVRRGRLLFEVSADSAAVIEVEAGSSFIVPAGLTHAEGANEPAEVVLCGDGPLVTVSARR